MTVIKRLTQRSIRDLYTGYNETPTKGLVMTTIDPTIKMLNVVHEVTIAAQKGHNLLQDIIDMPILPPDKAALDGVCEILQMLLATQNKVILQLTEHNVEILDRIEESINKITKI